MPNPFPLDPNQSHAVDSLPVGSVVIKVNDRDIQIDNSESGVHGETIPHDDAFELVPVGSSVTRTQEGVQFLAPATETRRPIVTIGPRFITALAQVWQFVGASDVEIDQILRPSEVQPPVDNAHVEEGAEQFEERRSDDQPAAMEEALLSVTLPDHDRRSE